MSREQKTRVCVYGDGLDYYVEKFILLDTYRISTTKVKVSLSSYERLIQKIYRMLYKENLIEHVKPNDEFEKLLLSQTKLNTAPFTSIAQMTLAPTTKIDIIEVVLRCGPSKYEGHTQNRCQIETELKVKMEKDKDFLVILGRNIGISPYQGVFLQIRFNSKIHINPTHPHASRSSRSYGH
ncbi:hypothetical protein R3W88_024704 [Solanum pinnatisectum]|uniref:Uncharacterized protein n=1 Tax=Solanum pinnatisectum TaxID=50273 RepID=A0AAV9M1E7_9SOLN|nr:hypothetical protein R3W88_024704 [Solanum pinnatisectum]